MPAESRQMRLVVLILAAILASSFALRAETTNLATSPSGKPGAAARLVLAQRTYQAALSKGDGVLLLAAIRLARGVALNPPTGWTKTTTGDAPADQPTGRAAAADPAAPQAIAIVQSLAEEDTTLQDLVYDLDAQLPHGRRSRAVQAMSDLAGGQTDNWRVALSGEVPAEFGVIGDGDSALGMTVTDASGAIVCAVPPGFDPALCRFTPARNGFFSVAVWNQGAVWNSYRMIGS